MSRSKVQKVVAPQETELNPVKLDNNPISEHRALEAAVVPKAGDRDDLVEAIGLVKTPEGWVHATFRVPLSMAVKRTEPEVRFIAVEHFKRDAVYAMIGEKR